MPGDATSLSVIPLAIILPLSSKTACVPGSFRTAVTSADLLAGDWHPGQEWFIQVDCAVVRHIDTKSAVNKVCRYEMQKNICQFVCNYFPKLSNRGLHAISRYSHILQEQYSIPNGTKVLIYATFI